MTPTFNQKLQIEKTVFDEQRFKKAPMPEVVQYLREYKATGKYPYNADVLKYIQSKETVSGELIDTLDTEIYLAQQFLRAEQLENKTHEMADKGFIPVKAWNGYVGRAELVGKKSLDWATTQINKVGKIIALEDGGFFIPKGNRTRGYYLRNLDEAFYKPIN